MANGEQSIQAGQFVVFRLSAKQYGIAIGVVQVKPELWWLKLAALQPVCWLMSSLA